MVSSDRIWHLIARALNDEASPAEREELSSILSENGSLQQQYEILLRMWQENENNPEEETDVRQTISRIINRSSTESYFVQSDRRSRLRRRWMIAATVVVFLACGAWFINSNRSYTSNANSQGETAFTQQESLVSKNGSRTRSLLPDGTTVWLNAGSNLYYENDFTGKTREVRLEGEAFFDVIKHEDKPFIVHTGGIEIKVLGTAFNVKSYPEDKNVETTLYRGSVKVFRAQEAEANAINMQPNQKLIVPKQAAIEEPTVSKESGPVKMQNFILDHIDSTKKESERFETAWLYSRLEFRDVSFEELAYKLQRWYNVNIRFEDEKVKRLNFNGSFEKETAAQAFMALQAASPRFTYKINNHEILVRTSE